MDTAIPRGIAKLPSNCAKNPQSHRPAQAILEISAGIPSMSTRRFCRLAEGRLRPRHVYRSMHLLEA